MPYEQAADDLCTGKNGRGGTGDCITRFVAVELQKIRLCRVKRKDCNAAGEYRRKHHPADRRITHTKLDCTRNDIAHLAHKRILLLRFETLILHKKKCNRECRP